MRCNNRGCRDLQEDVIWQLNKDVDKTNYNLGIKVKNTLKTEINILYRFKMLDQNNISSAQN